MSDFVVALTTVPADFDALGLAKVLVERGLAACVNILPGMTAIYVWDGKLNRETEAVLIIKTVARLANRVIAEAKALHPYDNPALVVLPISGGSADFLAWIAGQTREPS